MKKLLLAVVMTVVLSASAQAQIGLCVTSEGDPCSGLIEQLAQFARQLLQLEQEIITAEQEVLNTLALPGALFQDATAVIGQVTQIASQADLLANPLTSGFIQNLAAAAYPLPNNGMQQLVLHQNAVANAISTLGQGIAVESPRLAAASAILNSLQGETFGNLGRHQTLQDAAQIQAAHAQQLQSYEAIKIAEMQAQHATLLADNDRRAMANQWGDLAATAYTPYPMTGQNF